MRKYGWVPDLPDARDYILKYDPSEVLPPRVDLRDKMSPIENQGAIGSCTAQAYAAIIEYLDKLDGSFEDRSRLYIYFNERLFIGQIHEDSGARMRDGIKALRMFGAAAEPLWPYVEDKFDEFPPIRAYIDGFKHRIKSYYRATSFGAVKAALAHNYPVAFGFTVYESFESRINMTTGTMPMPKPYERVLGGHAVVAVGYDDGLNRVICRNSWGSSVHDQGYFFMPYDFISNPNYADDFWVIRTYRR
jgi:C1A family cysteine protease